MWRFASARPPGSVAILNSQACLDSSASPSSRVMQQADPTCFSGIKRTSPAHFGTRLFELAVRRSVSKKTRTAPTGAILDCIGEDEPPG
jgi:hypothetical protein